MSCLILRERNSLGPDVHIVQGSLNTIAIRIGDILGWSGWVSSSSVSRGAGVSVYGGGYSAVMVLRGNGDIGLAWVMIVMADVVVMMRVGVVEWGYNG